MVLHREGQVAALGEGVGKATLEVVETDAIVSDQHRRPRPLAVWPCQVADHRHAVSVIGDLSRGRHLTDASERVAPGCWYSLSAERAASPAAPRGTSPVYGTGVKGHDHRPFG